jgi:tetratricopeptide repeat protein/dolichyl-phosphate-mannose-protein mannosyltransferase
VRRRLAAILGLGLVLRVAYVLLQPRFDPTFGRPILDGAYYVASARALVSGGSTGGVYYMPPLYPWALSVFLRAFGDAWTLLLIAQQLAVVAGAGLMALFARRIAGDPAALAAAALALLYHPALFFASRPLGESPTLLLLAAGLFFGSRDDERSGVPAGVAAGLASLARPNFLPLAPLWAARDFVRGRARRAGLLILAALAVVLPAAWHNYAASGRLVPVSANGGVVFWLGNAPGAVGVYTPVNGFTGSLQTQQQEAIAEASARTGRAMDAVSSDGFWWREGLRARAADPIGTAVLGLQRAMLTLDSAEHGLDYAPALDTNPLRFAAPLPFAVLLGLAVFGLAAVGFARTGGFLLWSSVLVAAAAPLLFYVSSRHRLPLAFLLAVPAGAGLAALGTTRRYLPYAAGAGALVLSFAVPSGGFLRTEKASALAVVADVERKAGDLDAAAETSRRATELDASNAVAWFNRGVVEAVRGNVDEAERDYRAALDADPVQPDAAANLAGLLVRSGRASEAGPPLEKALAAWPRHTVGWTNLVVAYAASGDRARALDAARRASGFGVVLDPELVKSVEGAGAR